MEQFNRRRYEMLARVRDFGTTYGHLFPESTLAAKAFAVVTNAVGDIEARDVTQTTASVSARGTRKKDARRALYERLLLLAKTAQVIPDADAAFKAHFDLPYWPSDQVLLTTARQFTQRAEEVATQFVGHGMPQTFVSDLKTLIDGLEAAVRNRGMSRDQLVAARAGIRQALANGFTAVWQLDAIVANHLPGDKVVQEVWKRSRRMTYPPKRRQPTAPEAGPVDPPTAAPAPDPAAPASSAEVERPPLRLVTPAA